MAKDDGAHNEVTLKTGDAGSSLVPMLVWGLVLIVVGMLVAVAIS